jgi:hypothetical protein
MAGLGTGAAPFRAFLQHRALLAQQGISVGPVYYYFGSRHQSQEYLYGEEIEAYILDGTITKAGLAFSRDGPKKIYIQHKMLEDAQVLAEMLHDHNGVFYLCGPTWPVPDVYEALVGALIKYNGQDPETAGAFLEGLKEEERYVLEVSISLLLYPDSYSFFPRRFIDHLIYVYICTLKRSSFRLDCSPTLPIVAITFGRDGSITIVNMSGNWVRHLVSSIVSCRRQYQSLGAQLHSRSKIQAHTSIHYMKL